MAKEKIDREKKESPLVAVAIKEGDRTTLITPHGEYILDSGRLVGDVREVIDYASEIRDKITTIAKRASIGAGIYSDADILIQIRYGSKPIGRD